jgi:hypothetical protein
MGVMKKLTLPLFSVLVLCGCEPSAPGDKVNDMAYAFPPGSKNIQAMSNDSNWFTFDMQIGDITHNFMFRGSKGFDNAFLLTDITMSRPQRYSYLRGKYGDKEALIDENGTVYLESFKVNLDEMKNSKLFTSTDNKTVVVEPDK